MDSITIDQFLPEHFPGPSKVWLELSLCQEEHQPLSTPAIIVKGKEPGPIVVAVAGVHGDEFEGMEAIRGFITELNPQEMRGTFIGIPVINPLAYQGQTRETPLLWDGLNLARQFPGKVDGSITERLAFIWSSWLIHLLGPDDVFIDFHSAGTRYEYAPIIAFHQTNDQTEVQSNILAKAFGIDRVWRIPDREETRVTFNGCVARRGIPTIATEVRGLGGCRREDVAALQTGLRQIVTWKNIQSLLVDTSYNDIVESQKILWSTEWLLIGSTGFFRPQVDLLANVAQGQLLGELVSLVGEILEEVYAPMAGQIWGIRRFSTVQSGDYVFLIAFKL